MDTTQLLLTATLTVTTIFLIIVGIQLIFVLRELRATLKRINTIVEGFEKVGSGIEHGFSEVAGFVGGMKSLFKVLEVINSKRDGKHKQL